MNYQLFINQIKKQAYEVKESLGLTYNQALDHLCKKADCKSWYALNQAENVDIHKKLMETIRWSVAIEIPFDDDVAGGKYQYPFGEGVSLIDLNEFSEGKYQFNDPKHFENRIKPLYDFLIANKKRIKQAVDECSSSGQGETEWGDFAHTFWYVINNPEQMSEWDGLDAIFCSTDIVSKLKELTKKQDKPPKYTLADFNFQPKKEGK